MDPRQDLTIEEDEPQGSARPGAPLVALLGVAAVALIAVVGVRVFSADGGADSAAMVSQPGEVVDGTHTTSQSDDASGAVSETVGAGVDGSDGDASVPATSGGDSASDADPVEVGSATSIAEPVGEAAILELATSEPEAAPVLSPVAPTTDEIVVEVELPEINEGRNFDPAISEDGSLACGLIETAIEQARIGDEDGVTATIYQLLPVASVAPDPGIGDMAEQLLVDDRTQRLTGSLNDAINVCFAAGYGV